MAREAVNPDRPLIGYVDPWSPRAGESLRLFAHAPQQMAITVELIELVCACDDPGAPGLMTRATGISCEVLAGRQKTQPGSYGLCPAPAGLMSSMLSLAVLFKPTSRKAGALIGLYDNRGLGYGLIWNGAGGVEAHRDGGQGDGGQIVALPCERDSWALAILQVDRATGLIGLVGGPVDEPFRRREAYVEDLGQPWSAQPNVWFASRPNGRGGPTCFFDGRLEAPAVFDTKLESPDVIMRPSYPRACPKGALAAWDFAQERHSWRIVDVGPSRAHGRLFQGPVRNVPGAFWSGSSFDPARDPAAFGAIHFHADDLLEAGWDLTTALELPSDLSSGVYGLRMSGAGVDEDIIPLWVRPSVGAKRNAMAFLAPTFTYLAYANAPDTMLGPNYAGRDYRFERIRRANPAFGRSLYDRHDDGSGVSLSSRRRPVLTVRPSIRPWGFPADSLLTHWLATTGRPFDVLTDEDLDREGYTAIEPYRALLTGNHPEYWSDNMLDGLEAWLERGGRLAYLGGNGLYWRTGRSAAPDTIEVRRAEDGTRPWIAAPAEYHHQLDGNLGGLWRRLGRPPNRTVGVGFAAQGFEGSTPYSVCPEARGTWAGWALEGVSDGLLGEVGLFGGGAAGQEIDRCDPRMGSPPDAVVIASSQGLHDAAMLRTKEEFLSTSLSFSDRSIRADLTLTPKPKGGAVFSTGSMAFVGALADPGVAQILSTIIDRFLDPAPIAVEPKTS